MGNCYAMNYEMMSVHPRSNFPSPLIIWDWYSFNLLIVCEFTRGHPSGSAPGGVSPTAESGGGGSGERRARAANQRRELSRLAGSSGFLGARRRRRAATNLDRFQDRTDSLARSPRSGENEAENISICARNNGEWCAQVWESHPRDVPTKLGLIIARFCHLI